MTNQKFINYRLGGETWEPRFITPIDQKKCSQCCSCISTCTASVFMKTVKGTVEARRMSNCIGCGSCERVCREKAIKCLSIDKHPRGIR